MIQPAAKKKFPKWAKITLIVFGCLFFLILIIGIFAPDPPVAPPHQGSKLANSEKTEHNPLPVDAAKQTALKAAPAAADGDAINMPPDEALATLDEVYDTHSTKFKRYSYLLSNISKEFNEPVDSVAEVISKVQSYLTSTGIEVTHLQILEDLNKAQNKGQSFMASAEVYASVRANQ